eukprot:1917386-Pleurochrysis_carterae.AAC.1
MAAAPPPMQRLRRHLQQSRRHLWLCVSQPDAQLWRCSRIWPSRFAPSTSTCAYPVYRHGKATWPLLQVI